MEQKTLGDYSLIKQIGQGSLGTVHLAEHRYMNRQYILKVLPEELATDRAFIQRFEEDVSILASLDHPNIVKIHNITFAQGQYFLVTDCIVDALAETTNLAQYHLATGKQLDELSTYTILYQIASALDYAHCKGKGIAHRGLKLNNVLVGTQGENGIQVYLSDFGLSRIIGPGAVLSRTYKAVAESIGMGSISQERYTPVSNEMQKLAALNNSFLQNFAFLAPEQKKIEQNLSQETKVDVYAFGVLAYHLLTGDFPEGIFDMPSEKCPNYQYDWDYLVLQCLQSNPIKRAELLLPILESVKDSKSTWNMAQELAAYVSEPIAAVAAPVVEMAVAAASSTTNNPKPVIRLPQLERPVTDLDPAAALIVDTAVKNYVPERKEVKNMQPMMTEMVVILGGDFIRGSNDGNRDEMPRHIITIDSFAIDIHPVTNEQFVRFLEAMGGEKDSNHNDIIRMRDSRIKRSAGKLIIESGYNKHPVVGLTWYGAVAYAKWIGKRLPTEGEWEIAARGGLENSYYPTGDDIEKTQANFFSSDTTAVMSYPSNAYGLFDMAGNVYEWCQDWYGYNYYEVSAQEPDNPKGPIQGVYRVLRGGCWKSLKEDLRCSGRHRNNPGTVNGTYGFRCAADVE